MPFQVDFRIQNTNAEAVEVEIELRDPLNPQLVDLYDQFDPLPAFTTRVFTAANIPADSYSEGTIRFRGIESGFLDSLPVSIDDFRTNPPITNVSLDFVNPGGQFPSTTVTQPTVATFESTWNWDLSYTNPLVGQNYPTLITDPTNQNYKWDYRLVPRSGLTGDQTKLVFDEQASTANAKVYTIDGLPNTTLTVRPYRFGLAGEPSVFFDHKGVQVEFKSTSTLNFDGTGAFDIEFELFIQGTEDATWDLDASNGQPYEGLRQNPNYLSSYSPQITTIDTVNFTLTSSI